MTLSSETSIFTPALSTVSSLPLLVTSAELLSSAEDAKVLAEIVALCDPDDDADDEADDLDDEGVSVAATVAETEGAVEKKPRTLKAVLVILFRRKRASLRWLKQRTITTTSMRIGRATRTDPTDSSATSDLLTE